MQMKVFGHFPKNDQKRLVKRVKKVCRTKWLSLQVSVDTAYCKFINNGNIDYFKL